MSQALTTKTAADNWKIVRRRVISYIRMQRMAENLIGIKEQRRDTEDEEFSRMDRFMILPDNRKLFYFNQLINFAVMADIIYAIEL